MSGGQWKDSAANSFLHSGLVSEFRLTGSGFDFGMASGETGSVRKISPGDRPVRVDITLPGDSFFDSVATPPGQESIGWEAIAARPGAAWTLPVSAATDGLQTATLHLDLDATEALVFQGDIDRMSDIDGGGLAPGTLVTAHFTDIVHHTLLTYRQKFRQNVCRRRKHDVAREQRTLSSPPRFEVQYGWLRNSIPPGRGVK